jgi:hypothetical protein
MIESEQRIEQFKQEVADMRLRDPATARDRQGLRFAIVLMFAAVVIEVVAYFMAYNGQSLDQGDATVLALGGVVAAIIGAGLFVRFSLANFMRYWLARVTYEQNVQTDRVVEALNK